MCWSSARCIRAGRQDADVVEFFYPEEICAFEREFIEAQQAAYMETCVEDDGSRCAWMPAARR